MTYKIKTICCIGAGYVGGPTMTVMADKCPNIKFEVVDLNKERIERWNDSNLQNLPIYEPGLAEIVARCRGKNLHFSNLVEEKIKQADMIFISVNTPTKKKGLGAGKASDLKWVEACARQVAKYAEGYTIVVEKSTLPVKTAEVINAILQTEDLSNNKNSKFDILSNPEFLSEGSAIEDLIKPDRVLIGGERKEAIESLSKIYKNWIPEEKIITTNIWSSELAKLTANAFLAQRISSINSISALCEMTGANVKEVSRAIGSDNRIGSKFLTSGPGFGGSCFKKDILNLVYLCNYYGLNEVAQYWENVIRINDWQQERIYKNLLDKLFGTVFGKKIIILGFSFKANTNDTRESSAIPISKNLINEGAHLLIHDPKVSLEQISKDLGLDSIDISLNTNKDTNINGSWSYIFDLEKAFLDVDAVLILTEWDEYRNIDWKQISTQMRHPAWVMDSRLILNKNEITSSGLNYWGLGIG